MTRATYTLSGVEGPLFFDKDGSLTFVEKEGIDYAATTVQLPGGERVPFMFTVKELEAKSTDPSGINVGTEFGGTFKVPSYRSGLFLDPKGRGGTTGYDMAQALRVWRPTAWRARRSSSRRPTRCSRLLMAPSSLLSTRWTLPPASSRASSCPSSCPTLTWDPRRPRRCCLRGSSLARLA